jgi:hypothetical protein
MQTLEFTDALTEIVKGLKAEEIVAIIQGWFGMQFVPQQPPALPDQVKDAFSELLLSSRSGFDKLSTRPTTGRILAGLGVKDFYEPGRTRQLIIGVSNAPSYAQVRALPDVHAYFEKFRSLVRLASTCRDLLEKEKVGELQPSEGIVRVEIINYADEDGISPKRLATFVEAISDLHRDVAIILGIPSDVLTFKYFDSGSDLLVGVKCGKEIAETLNTLLRQVWEKFRFWRYDTFEKRMASISKGLDIVDRIHESVQKGAVTEEEGNILKVKIFQKVDVMIGIGATVPLGESATLDQKQLLTEMRNTKLLGSGESPEAGAQPGRASPDAPPQK